MSGTYPMFTEPTIARVSSGFYSGYMKLDTKIVYFLKPVLISQYKPKDLSKLCALDAFLFSESANVFKQKEDEPQQKISCPSQAPKNGQLEKQGLNHVSI